MELSESNLMIATEFFVGDTTNFDKKDDDYKNLFLAYASDKNSSSIREAVTLNFLGYERYKSKHGADGIDKTTGREKEVKPRYFSTGGKGKAKIGGNFNDMTMELLDKKKEFDIICSVFVDDRLILVVEFPISVIFEKLKKPIIDAKLGKRVVCPFSNTSFQDSSEMVIHHYDVDFINKNKSLADGTAIFFKNKYAHQLSK
jgi:hypothetical protein